MSGREREQRDRQHPREDDVGHEELGQEELEKLSGGSTPVRPRSSPDKNVKDKKGPAPREDRRKPQRGDDFIKPF